MISQRLQAFRKNKGLSQVRVAVAVNMPQSTWAGWEKEPPDALRLLAAIARHYNVSADYLLGLTDNEMPGSIRLGDEAQRLIAVLRTLPSHRQHDLLAIAELFAQLDEANE